MDLFDKAYTYNDAEEVMKLGLYPYFRMNETAVDTTTIMNGRKTVMIGSNNYLGLTSHPYVKEAAIKAVEKYGTGCTGSRFLNGTIDLHVKLEARLAKFMKKEDCLVFTTGFTTNQGISPRSSANTMWWFAIVPIMRRSSTAADSLMEN